MIIYLVKEDLFGNGEDEFLIEAFKSYDKASQKCKDLNKFPLPEHRRTGQVYFIENMEVTE